MDEFQATQYLVQKVADVVVAELLRAQKFIEIRFHELLDNVADSRRQG